MSDVRVTAEALGRLRDPKAEDGWGRGVENGTQRTSSGQTTQVSGHSQQLGRGAEVSEAVKGPNCSRGGKGSCVERAAASKPVETQRGKLRPEEIQSLPIRQRTKHAGGLTWL